MSIPIITSLIKFICIAFIGESCNKYEAFDISDTYAYPTINSDNPGEYTIAIFGTNDIHGYVLPMEITHSLTNETYNYGGLQYLSNYIDILKDEWKDRFLWLDAGDQFQGGIESKLSNGTIMTEFFNKKNMDASAIGNHEFDNGMEFIYSYLGNGKFPYLAANIYNNNDGAYEFMPNTKRYKIFNVGEIKVGVIGLTTKTTLDTCANDLSDIGFNGYKKLVTGLSKELRLKGADVVILTTHIGTVCPKEDEATLDLRFKTTKQNECRDSELKNLIEELDDGVIDAVVGGHIHRIVHQWIKGVPVIQNINGGYYSHVMYLTFNKTTKKLVNSSIEGPLPSCEKVFRRTKKCNWLSPDQAKADDYLVHYKFHGRLISEDNVLADLFNKWKEEIKPYKKFIAHSEIELHRSRDSETSLGNMGPDCFRRATGADFGITNTGLYRTHWYPGPIMVDSILNMFPFKNDLVTCSIKGFELKKMMEILQKGEGAYHHVSGMKMDVRLNSKNLVTGSLKMADGRDIEDERVYSIAALDYSILHGGEAFKEVTSWYLCKDLKNYGLISDIMIQCLKEIKIIKEETFYNPKNKRLNIIDI
jgi:2',3'-cyclic-nucleotide 2'-phosphodiesterase (5'-nucleotidase family)